MVQNLKFDNQFATLPEDFYTKMAAEGFVEHPTLVHINHAVATDLKLSDQFLQSEEFLTAFSGGGIIDSMVPLAQVYSGHQFGVWAGQLGDGRALMLGQVRDKNNKLIDLQLKGSGLTPYSRRGDGRAVMRSVLREYLCGEAMHGLGISTTRALGVIATNQDVAREINEAGAIMIRTGESHIRFGHFEHLYHHDKKHLVQILADHVIRVYHGDNFTGNNKYKDWFKDLVSRTAKMIANWQAVGFCHGVMNTDNMSILGLTIDYGPFGFMDDFDAGHVCNTSDHQGRYAYDQQPSIGLWNLQALSYALQPLISFSDIKTILESYGSIFAKEYHAIMAKKLGLKKLDDKRELLRDLLTLMHQDGVDYTLIFRTLSTVKNIDGVDVFVVLFKDKEKARTWAENYFECVKKNGLKKRMDIMLKTNPKFILRNWIAEDVIRSVIDDQDYSKIDDVMLLLKNPFSEHEASDHYATAPKVEQKNICLSCSS